MQIIRSANITGTLYKVTEINHTDCIDWKGFTKQRGSDFTRVTKLDETVNEEVKDGAHEETHTYQEAITSNANDDQEMPIR